MFHFIYKVTSLPVKKEQEVTLCSYFSAVISILQLIRAFIFLRSFLAVGIIPLVYAWNGNTQFFPSW